MGRPRINTKRATILSVLNYKSVISMLTMNYLDISESLRSKLGRMYEALRVARIEKLPDFALVSDDSVAPGFYGADFSQGRNDADMRNAAATLISNIASLKDHLKVWCKRHSREFSGDRLINSNFDVAVVHDLWNLDKHAELIGSRSGRFPVLGHMQQAIEVTVNGSGGMCLNMDLQKGQAKPSSIGDASLALVLSASVQDHAGAFIGNLLSICERAVVAWENEFVRVGFIPPLR